MGSQTNSTTQAQPGEGSHDEGAYECVCVRVTTPQKNHPRCSPHLAIFATLTHHVVSLKSHTPANPSDLCKAERTYLSAKAIVPKPGGGGNRMVAEGGPLQPGYLREFPGLLVINIETKFSRRAPSVTSPRPKAKRNLRASVCEGGKGGSRQPTAGGGRPGLPR